MNNYRYCKSYHGFSWEDNGFIPYAEVSNLLNEAMSKYDKIYCKGLEKLKWLFKDTSNEIINIEDLNISFRLRDCKMSACSYHYGVCALRNVCLINFVDNFIE